MAIKDHLKDIDFRTKAERQKCWKEDFIAWYKDMTTHQSLAYNDEVQAKITILSSVLWYLLPENEYRNLTKFK